MAYELFNSKAPWIMALLMRDFDLVLDDGCAILGNIGHECGGFKLFQEQKPLVPGSRGGFGWAQWTGPRRRAFEAYRARNKLDPKSDQANYGFLFVELSGSESAAITKVKAAKGLHAKVRAFEATFERAGVKHYDSRDTWAKRARAAWDAVGGKPTIPEWAQKPASGSRPAPAPSPAPDQQSPPAPPQDGTKPDVIVVDGPRGGESTVVVAPTPQNEPATPAVPTSKTGLAALAAIIVGIATGISKCYGG